jgi:hypothetical protein
LETYGPVPKPVRQEIGDAIRRRNINQAAKLLNRAFAHLNLLTPAIHFHLELDAIGKQAIGTRSNILIRSSLLHWGERIGKEAPPGSEDPSLGAQFDPVIRVMVGLLVYLSNRPPASHLSPPRRPTAPAPGQSPRFITSEAEICETQGAYHPPEEAPQEERRTHRPGGYEVSPHHREGYYRRRSGEGNNPDAPRVIWVGSAKNRATRNKELFNRTCNIMYESYYTRTLRTDAQREEEDKEAKTFFTNRRGEPTENGAIRAGANQPQRVGMGWVSEPFGYSQLVHYLHGKYANEDRAANAERWVHEHKGYQLTAQGQRLANLHHESKKLSDEIANARKKAATRLGDIPAGVHDRLYDCTLIIDEADDLFRWHTGKGLHSDMLREEDFYELQEAIQNSYKKSGSHAVRVLLMTATPANTSLGFFQLLNMLIPKRNDRYVFPNTQAEIDAFRGTPTLAQFQQWAEAAKGAIVHFDASADEQHFARVRLFTQVAVTGMTKVVEKRLNKVRNKYLALQTYNRDLATGGTVALSAEEQKRLYQIDRTMSPDDFLRAENGSLQGDMVFDAKTRIAWIREYHATWEEQPVLSFFDSMQHPRLTIMMNNEPRNLHDFHQRHFGSGVDVIKAQHPKVAALMEMIAAVDAEDEKNTA